MPTTVRIPKEIPRELNGSSTIITDGTNVYEIEDVKKGANVNFAGVDIVRRQSGKPSELLFSYPYLQQNPNTELVIDGKKVRVSFTQ